MTILLCNESLTLQFEKSGPKKLNDLLNNMQLVGVELGGGPSPGLISTNHSDQFLHSGQVTVTGWKP